MNDDLKIDSFNRNARVYYLDCVKGILTFLVIWGHCMIFGTEQIQEMVETSVLLRFIYMFHMPCFMLISFYFLGVKSSSEVSLYPIKKD